MSWLDAWAYAPLARANGMRLPPRMTAARGLGLLPAMVPPGKSGRGVGDDLMATPRPILSDDLERRDRTYAAWRRASHCSKPAAADPAHASCRRSCLPVMPPT